MTDFNNPEIDVSLAHAIFQALVFVEQTDNEDLEEFFGMVPAFQEDEEALVSYVAVFRHRLGRAIEASQELLGLNDDE